jgi:hypothetical protein
MRPTNYSERRQRAIRTAALKAAVHPGQVVGFTRDSGQAFLLARTPGRLGDDTQLMRVLLDDRTYAGLRDAGVL